MRKIKGYISVIAVIFAMILVASFKVKKQESEVKVIHIFVALCDNKFQGIVPVPEKIGNGKDLKNNLYWGCGYGVKMFFKNKSLNWNIVKSNLNPSTNVLERVVYKHKTKNIYLVADAYDGEFIRQTTIDFFDASAGNKPIEIKLDNHKTIIAGGASNLICYVGHDGLMDFQISNYPTAQNKNKRETIILACYSKSYFSEGIKKTGASPLIWSTGLMSPEAYTLEGAINGWIEGKSNEEIRTLAAQAYCKYQKTCSLKSAKRLLVTGW